MTKEEAIRMLKYNSNVIHKTIHGETDPNEVEALDMAITALEQEPRWTPVSEGLPKKSGNYWCTFGGTNLTGSDYYTTESDAKEIFDDPEEYAGWQSQNVIAWMPLPKPYEPQENCDTCKHKDEEWDSDACDGCCGANSKWSGEIYPGEFEAMEHNGRMDALESEEHA